MLAMEAGGADIIELGVPFTDPLADGPAIQESNNVHTLRFPFLLPPPSVPHLIRNFHFLFTLNS
jgi:hypothetical protein